MISTVIIPHLNNVAYLKQCVEALQRTTDDFELVIVDNHSTDGTIDYLTSSALRGIKGRLITNVENKGFGIACNQGAKIAKGKYLCFLNNDTIPTKGWLNAMIKCFEEEKSVGVVGAKLLHPGTGNIQHAGVVEIQNGTPYHVYFGKPNDYSLANKRKEYFAVTGACLLTTKDLFDKIGGFDDRYFCGWEDIHYCNEIKKLGYKIFYEPTSVVYHYESRTGGRYSKESQNWNLYVQTWILNKGEKNGL